ncbi:hypothetical protein B7463_g11548, partial [Scytalidium lignicola]
MGLVTASEGIQDWTPFIMVLCYFVFSVSVYMVATSGVMKVFWFIYLMTNTYIASTTVLEALMSVGAFHEARQSPRSRRKVAYLPNEQDIIMDHIHYLLEKIVYPRDKLCINVMYNTPMTIEPLETEMHDLALKHSNLRVVKVPNSKSKADNLNYYCSLDTGADVSAIYDCGHYPHPYGSRWAIKERGLWSRCRV